MFELLQTEADHPLTFIAAPSAVFEPGMVGQLMDGPNGLLVCGVSDGANPLGIIDSIKEYRFKEIDYNNFVRIWWMRAKVVTDKYVRGEKYKDGCGLYVDKNGLFTPQILYENAYPVARLLTAPTSKAPYCEILWI